MITVMTTNYNMAAYLPKAIESILAQTYKDFELLVVDDESSDNSVEIIQSYVEKDDRVRLLQIEHGGIVKARNAALQAAKYPWIAILDADDIAVPTRLEKQIKAAEEKPHVVAWSTYAYRTNSNEEVFSVAQTGPVTEEEFYEARKAGRFSMMLNNAMMIKRDLAIELGGYDARFEGGEDMELLDRMANYGPTLTIPEPLVYYRMHTGSTTITQKKFREQRFWGRYLHARNQHRLENKQLSYPDFVKEYENRVTGIRKIVDDIDNVSAYHLRIGAVYFGERQYSKAIIPILISFFLNPYYILYRVWYKFILRRPFDNGRI